ncbi:MAG: hypothetical protein ACR2LE_09865 [Nocardioidaceae bacterium]
MLRRVSTSSWLPVAVTAVGIVAILLHSGSGLQDIAVYAVYAAGTIAVPGVFVWRLLLSSWARDSSAPPTWFEDLSLGTILGFGIQLPVYLLGVWAGVPLLFLALPVVVVAVSLALPAGRGVWTRPSSRLDYRAAWALAVVVLYGSAWLARRVFVLRPLTLSPHQTPSTDETFHLALISHLMHRFPPQIPYLLGTRLDYHWFVHAQLAASTWATSVESTVLLRQLLPALVVPLTLLGLGAVALRLTDRTVAAVIAPALLVVGSFFLMGPHYEAWAFTEPYLSKRLVSSPSQNYGFMIALPAIALILEVLRPDRRAPRLTWVALAVSLFALSGAKATFLPLFLCGAVVVWLAQLAVLRRVDLTATALVGLMAVVTAFAQVVLLGGSSGALALDPFQTVQASLQSQKITDTFVAEVAMTLSLLIGWLLYGVGVLGLRRGGTWRDPRAWWLVASVPPGIVVALFFFRSGLSQLWFQRSVAEMVVLASTWGLALLLPDPLPRSRALTLCGLAAASGLGVFVLSTGFEHGVSDVTLATTREVVATAVAPLAVAAVFALFWLGWRRTTGRRLPGLVLIVLLLGLPLSHGYSLVHDTVTRAPQPEASTEPLFAAGGVTAAQWLERHSSSDDVVATNIHCASPDTKRCDNRSFWVSAYTERRIVVEGWGYTAGTNGEFESGTRNAYLPIPDPRRLAVNDRVFLHPSRRAIRRLVNRYGVRWLFVSLDYPVKIERLAALKHSVREAYTDDNYVIFGIRKP